MEHFLRGEGSIWVEPEGREWFSVAGGSKGTGGIWRGHCRDSTAHGALMTSRSPVWASGQGSGVAMSGRRAVCPHVSERGSWQSLDRVAFCVSLRVFIDSPPRAELRPRHRGSYSEELGHSQSSKYNTLVLGRGRQRLN